MLGASESQEEKRVVAGAVGRSQYTLRPPKVLVQPRDILLCPERQQELLEVHTAGLCF